MRTYINDVVIDKTNRICGFVENIRNKRTMAFIVLRDVSGKIQLTVEKEKHPELVETIDAITLDSVIVAEGPVVENSYVKMGGKEIHDNIKYYKRH